MASKYIISDHQCPHFITFSIIQWVDVLARQRYKKVVIASLRFCQGKKGLILYSWVIMSNHIHLIASAEHGYNLSDILRDFKKFTANSIIDLIKDNVESRRSWMLWLFKAAGSQNSNNKYYQVWQQDNHPIELSTSTMLYQRVEYIHMNPVKAGIVYEPHQYIYSSAIDYAGGKGLLELEDL